MAPSLPDDTFLLCIDLQPVFLRTLADGARLQRRCALAVAAARGLGLPVGFSEQVPEKLGGTAPELLALAPDAPIWPKRTFSALADPTIGAALGDTSGVRHLLLAGLETAVCVHQTAADALAAGLQVTILCDAVGGRRLEDGAACLATLARAGAHVLPVETVFYALLHDTGHPFFKAYTQLVKAHA